ncbi:MAG: M48 family metalloprotease [Planctomycetota bacterium]
MPIFGRRRPSYQTRGNGLGGLFGSGRKRSNRGGKGIPIRLLLAVGIAVFAFVSFYFNTSINPVTGKAERIGGIDAAQEVALGLNAAPQMVQQMGGRVRTNDPRARLVEAVGRRLLDEGGISRILREKNVPWEFSFTLLEDDQLVNAFALPGGPVFITEALFNRLENEAQLAGILGHEIGHVIERHGLERMAKGQLGQQLVGAVAVGAGDSGQMATAAAQMANNMMQMSYSREAELESDAYGLDAMVAAGYDPSQMIRVMEILAEASGGSGGGRGSRNDFMQTHPHPEKRIEAIEAFLRTNFPEGVPPTLSTGRRFH